MPFRVPIEEAKKTFEQFEFVSELTPSEQKAAFHVRDADGQDLCLKLISPDYEIDRLNREIKALQEIAHPNVVRFEEYTYSSKGGNQLHYIVEEFIEGKDLAEHLQEGEPWNRPRVAKFFVELSDGLESLRQANVVHRDLKPNNVRVRTSGSPVIIDFGLVRHLSLPHLTKTEQGAAIGTPLYFAPEQFEGTKYDIDHRTDLFAVGILIYQALIGNHPFNTSGISWADLKEAVCEGNSHFESSAFSGLPGRWQVVVRRLLAKSRAKRFATAQQLRDLLHKLEEV